MSVFETAIFYALVLGGSLLFFYFADCTYNKIKIKKGYIVFRRLFLFIAVLLPCLLAGLRADTVGTDVLVYAKPNFLEAYELGSFNAFLKNNKLEFLYNVLTYISAHWFKSFSFMLFITEALICIPIVVALVKLKKKKGLSIASGMFVFYIMYFFIGFNMMRQSISCSFLLLAFLYWLEDKKKLSIFLMVIAQLFHKTSIIGITLIFLIYYIVKIRNKTYRYLIMIFICLVSVIVTKYLVPLLDFFNDSGLFLKYENYSVVFNNVARGTNSLFIETKFAFIGGKHLLNFFVPLIVCLCFKMKSKSIILYQNMMFLVWLINILTFAVFHTVYGSRFTMYLEYFNIFYFNEVFFSKKDIKFSFGMKTIGVVYLIIGFIRIYFIGETGHVVPYSFS